MAQIFSARSQPERRALLSAPPDAPEPLGSHAPAHLPAALAPLSRGSTPPRACATRRMSPAIVHAAGPLPVAESRTRAASPTLPLLEPSLPFNLQYGRFH
jgi:hypothetical protein